MDNYWEISPCDYIKGCQCSDGKCRINGGGLSFIVDASNTTFPERGITYTLTYVGTKTVTKTVHVDRNECGVECVCDDILFTPISNRVFGVNALPNVTFGTISFRSGTGCEDIVKPFGSDGLSNLRIESNSVIGDISEYVQKEQENARILKIGFKIDDTPCDEMFEFYQQAFRGTDNGVDSFADGTEKSYPIFLVGYSNPEDAENEDDYCKRHHAYGTCATFMIHGTYDDEDSIVSEGGAYIYYNGIPYKFSRDLFSSTGAFPGGMRFGDWLIVDAYPDNDGYCGVGFIRLSATTEWDGGLPDGRYVNTTLGEAITNGYVRRVRFMLGTDPASEPTTIMVPDPNSLHGGEPEPGKCKCYQEGCPSPEHQGEQCAKTWFYDVIQIPKGHHICYNEDGNYLNYRLLPLSVFCDKEKNKGNCECNHS